MDAATIHTPTTNAPHAFHEIRQGGTLWGVVAPETLETADPARLQAIGGCPRLILRSGAATDNAEANFASWSSAGWEAFDASVASALDRLGSLDAACRLIIWPGQGSVLSDAVSTLTFSRKETGAALLLDPGAWITESMRADAEDHLRRFGQALAMCEAAIGVVIRPIPGVLDGSQAESLLTPTIGAVAGRGGIVIRA